MKQDIFGKTPGIGATIVFNPPKYKGLEYGKIVGFSKAGCPMVADEHLKHGRMLWEFRTKNSYTVKTDFVIVG